LTFRHLFLKNRLLFRKFPSPPFRLDFPKAFRSTPSLLDFGFKKKKRHRGQKKRAGPTVSTLFLPSISSPPLPPSSLHPLLSSPLPSLLSPLLPRLPLLPFPRFLSPPSSPVCYNLRRSQTYSPGDISGDKGLVSAGRIDKDTPPLTTPRRASKSSAMDTPSHMFEVEVRDRPGPRFRVPAVRPVPTLARGAYSCSRKEREGGIAAFWHGF
jgi:hypothetical protein